MSDDYTPSIDTARECFVDGAAGEFIAEDFDRMIESVRAEERERIARDIEAQGITARDVPQDEDWMAVIHTRKADARIAREGA